VVEFLTDAGEWQPQELSLTMPGVRLYLISLLLCQHIPLIATAREKGIPLLTSSGAASMPSPWLTCRSA
jgi:hypothetical protein